MTYRWQGQEFTLRWQRLEAWLDAWEVGTSSLAFTSLEYADDAGLLPRDASADIQSYLNAQRGNGRRGTPRHVLTRDEGTRASATIWIAGESAKDATRLGRGKADDIMVGLMRTFVPDLDAMVERNPRIRRRVAATTDMVTDVLVRMLTPILTGEYDEE